VFHKFSNKNRDKSCWFFWALLKVGGNIAADGNPLLMTYLNGPATPSRRILELANFAMSAIQGFAHRVFDVAFKSNETSAAFDWIPRLLLVSVSPITSKPATRGRINSPFCEFATHKGHFHKVATNTLIGREYALLMRYPSPCL
jgi:hypothetical protein